MIMQHWEFILGRVGHCLFEISSFRTSFDLCTHTSASSRFFRLGFEVYLNDLHLLYYQVPHYPPDPHNKRHRHARHRLPAHEAAWPPPVREPLQDVTAGCFAGGTVLCMVKDLAGNNRGVHVLVVCYEITTVTFYSLSNTHLDNMAGQALFDDGADPLIVGADPDPEVKRPIFETVSKSQMILPDSEVAINRHFREVGLTFHLLKDVPGLISKNIEKSLKEAFRPLGMQDYNEVFWTVLPGRPAILDLVETKVG